MLHPDLCQQQKLNWCLDTKDLRRWVYCYFEKIGKLIVLESGEGPQLPIEGKLFKPQPQELEPEPEPGLIIRLLPANELFVGTLHKDGTILDENGNPIGKIAATLGFDENKRPVLITALPPAMRYRYLGCY